MDALEAQAAAEEAANHVPSYAGDLVSFGGGDVELTDLTPEQNANLAAAAPFGQTLEKLNRLSAEVRHTLDPDGEGPSTPTN